MIPLFLLTAAIALYAWADYHQMVSWDRSVVKAAKIAAVLLTAVLVGSGLIYLIGLFLWVQGIDAAVRAVIAKTKAIDKTSWWGKLIYNRYGRVWAERLVWAELLSFTLISLF